MTETTLTHLSEEAEKQALKHETAVRLHMQIRNSASMAAEFLLDFATGLKKMRDTRLYIELGYETFEEYTERAVGIKQSMAYNWIRVLEQLPPAMIEENAGIGITKLQLLTQVPAFDRENFIEQHDLESITVAELKEELKKYKDQSEQLSLLTQQNDEMIDRIDDLVRELEEAKQDEEEAREALESAGQAAVEVVQRKADEQIKALEAKTKQAEQELKTLQAEKDREAAAALKKIEEAAKEADNRVKAVQDSAKAEAVKELREDLSKMEGEKAAAIERAAALEKKLQVAADKTTVRFSFHLEAAMEQLNKLVEIIQGCEHEDTREKLSAAVAALVEKTKEAVQ